jgi:iron complex transport system ATP-binding protein
MNALLSFQQVHFRYFSQNELVYRDLSLDITHGSITALLGPNGAGKTTLLYLALGWLKPTRGKIFLNGRPLTTYSRRELGQWMGLVPQSEYISFDFSLLEYVLLGRAPYLSPLEKPREQDMMIAKEALERVGLSGSLNRSVLKLSGGEKQLLLTARALAQQPRLLLLDEPTSHLDLSNKVRLIHLLKSLSESGVTILFTTHEPDFVSAIATHLVLIRDGGIQDQGEIQDIFNSEKLSRLYQLPIRVAAVEGKNAVLWC